MRKGCGDDRAGFDDRGEGMNGCALMRAWRCVSVVQSFGWYSVGGGSQKFRCGGQEYGEGVGAARELELDAIRFPDRWWLQASCKSSYSRAHTCDKAKIFARIGLGVSRVPRDPDC